MNCESDTLTITSSRCDTELMQSRIFILWCLEVKYIRETVLPMGWVQDNYDSTLIRRAFDCLSKVIKYTVT